ncbi:phosphotransferase enzyme family protein [Neobacillus niacini]|uniref:phosphotransferase enzyme family protein n=1 Tax=Neobacillus niacini TaxID=86668 RepID=UPI001C8EA913|nr:phosphotransferase [Neobacillus niacini]MBY0144683.1 phosphotransferase [Neobacillus niacini]
MEKPVEILFTEDILKRFLNSFGLQSEVKKLGDFENYVFEVSHGDTPVILRITHSSHRSKDEIYAELDWMNYLNNQRVNCPTVFQSVNNQIIEVLQAADGSFFYGCLYSKVPGNPVKISSEEFNEQLFYAWGKATGQMHCVTKNYKPSKEAKLRPSWEDEELLDIETYVPNEEKIIKNSNLLINELKLLPKNKDNFGLIHSDIHSGNFFYDGESIHVFDFDDCSYHWYASDIAIPLYYSIMYGYHSASERERVQFAHKFLTYFVEGYEQHTSLPEGWKEQLPLFFNLRDITLFTVLHKKIPTEERDESLNKMIEGLRKRIINREPIVKLD